MSKNNLLLLIIVLLAIATGLALYNYEQKPSAPNTNVNKSLTKPSETRTGASIKISPPSFDLGVVKYGDVTKRIFKIENRGTEPLKILRLSTSCGCTSASIAAGDKTIAPGETVEMLVAFDPAVHKDDTDLGKLTRIVYIDSNDSQHPEAEVKIYADVVKVK